MIEPCGLSIEQYTALHSILSEIGVNGVRKRSLALVHGGGGTGKSFLVRQVTKTIQSSNYEVVCTCPTGAGAYQMTNGRTFHSAFKCGGRMKYALSTKSAHALREIFKPDVVMIIIDEISMLKAEFIVLLDERLRTLYDSTLTFGGKSFLLVRHI